MLNLGHYISSSDLFSVCLRTTDHLNLKLWIFSGHTASFKIEISKVQDFANFKLSPMIKPYGPAHEISVFLPMLMYLETGIYVLTSLLYPYFAYKNSEGPGESELSLLDSGMSTQSQMLVLILEQK